MEFHDILVRPFRRPIIFHGGSSFQYDANADVTNTARALSVDKNMSESLELEIEVEGHYPHCHYVGQIALHQRQSIPFAATDIDSHGPHDLGYVHVTPLLSPTMPSVYPVMSVLDDHDPLVGDRVVFLSPVAYSDDYRINDLNAPSGNYTSVSDSSEDSKVDDYTPPAASHLPASADCRPPADTRHSLVADDDPDHDDHHYIITSYPLVSAGKPMVNDDSMEITHHHAPDDCTYGHHPRCVMASDDALDDRPPPAPAPPTTILCLSANDASQLVAPIASGAFSLPVIVVLPHLQTSLYFILYSLL